MIVSEKDQKPKKPARCASARGVGVTDASAVSAADSSLVSINERALSQDLMERICSRANLNAAFRRVKSNKGAGGIDDMSVDDLHKWLIENGADLVRTLIEDRYQPSAIRSVKIPKATGGMRQLGIPTVVDRLVQQAIVQVLSPILEREFSDHSYGFRPGRGAHDALKRAQGFVESGLEFVVDIDFENFFDRVNHDILMSRLCKHVDDKRLLRLIRRFLQAGMMENGVVTSRNEGTPQGGPLSPLLANLLLDDLDKELERRGHKFCRYADDCNVYVGSQAAADRVLSSVTSWAERKLKLRVNKSKSAASLCVERKFLGYRLTPSGLAIAPESLVRLRTKLKAITRRRCPGAVKDRFKEINQIAVGWTQYFRYARCRHHLTAIDSWLRRRIRCLILHQCKRSYTRFRLLVKYGVPNWQAWTLALSGKCMWRLATIPTVYQALSNKLLAERGLKSFEAYYLGLTS